MSTRHHHPITHAACILLVCAALTFAARVQLAGLVPAGIDPLHLQVSLNRVVAQLAGPGARMPRPITVMFYRQADTPPSASWLPEWGGGGAHGPDSVFVPLDIPFAVERDLAGVIVHEMTHCVVMRVAGRVEVPRWFHEGAAMTYSGELSFEQGLTLARAVLTNAVPSFGDIDSVNLLPRSGAQLAYSQSHAAYAFLVKEYGVEAPRLILARAVTRDDFGAGFVEALGVTAQEFELLARKHIFQRYGMGFIAGDLYLVWLGIFVLAALAFVVVRLRRARRLREMAQSEHAAPGLSDIAASEGGHTTAARVDVMSEAPPADRHDSAANDD